MPSQEILTMAVTRMLSGVCTAGFSREHHPASVLRWVRPVKEHDTLLLGDLTTADKHVLEPFDVVELPLLRPRPSPPHTEDWLTEFIHQRPRLLRRLQGDARARFLAEHLDRSPQDVLVHATRSLCLLRPQRVWATFSRDEYSGKYQARMGFTCPELTHPEASTPRGVSVTDLRWCALGQQWLAEAGGDLTLRHEDVLARTNAQDLYLSLGLSRSYRGVAGCW